MGGSKAKVSLLPKPLGAPIVLGCLFQGQRSNQIEQMVETLGFVETEFNCDFTPASFAAQTEMFKLAEVPDLWKTLRSVRSWAETFTEFQDEAQS